MNHILIDYSNYIIKDNNQIDVIFYKCGDDIIVETTCTKSVCRYKGIHKFETVTEGRQFFDKHIDDIINDENISSFGVINPYWYMKWDWIKLDINGRPNINTVEPLIVECGNVNYHFNFDDKGNIAADQSALIIDDRFAVDSIAIISIAELASLKYGFQLKNFIERFKIERQISKLYKLIGNHIFKVRKSNGTNKYSILRDSQLMVNGIVNDILTYESLELMFLNCSELIDSKKTIIIHQHHHTY